MNKQGIIHIEFLSQHPFQRPLNYLSGLLFLAGLCSCSNDLPKTHKQDKYFGSYSKQYSQVIIENGPRQGFQYYDFAGTEYSYRYITTTITNDSMVPVHITISFSKEYKYLRLNDSLKSKIFLLPRELTPPRQQFDKSMSEELMQFLDKEVDVPVSLDTVIQPNERLVMTFGILTDMKYQDFMRTSLISSDKQFYLSKSDSVQNLAEGSKYSGTLFLGLKLDNSFVIPCGQILFLK